MVFGCFGSVYLRLRVAPSRKFVIEAPHNIGRPRFSPKGDQLVYESKGTIYVWDTSTLMELSNLPEDELTALAKNDLPESARPRLLRKIKTQLQGYFDSFAISEDGSRLASFGDGISMLWDLQRDPGEHQLADFGEDLFSGSCLLYTSPSPRDRTRSRMPSSA